jgi:4a-hydroxytetrahydrobiopterin dehydratase
MTDGMPLGRFHGEAGLSDWRVLLGGIEATFRCPSSDESVAFVREVATAAEDGAGRPEVDVRFPDTVHVTLRADAERVLAAADLDLAREISAAAARAGLRSVPTSASRVEIAIDALDIDAVRPFWLAVLGYEEEPTAEGGQVDAVADPLGTGPAFWFQQMDEPRPQRNRIHVDVTVPHDVAEERVAAALAAGGTLVTDAHARSFWVLADPEGNEACVCTWQDRG